jgi:isovaleryl-CoA dehydrogenase
MLARITRKAFSFKDFRRVSNLPHELREFQKNVQEYADREVLPLAEKIDKEDAFPMYLWNSMGEFGLLGLTCPEKYGGLDMGYTAQSIAMEELSRASGSVGLSYGAHSNLAINQFVRFGTEKQKEKFLPKLCLGEFVGALAMSEPNAGSDVVSMKTKAIKEGSNYILNGSKMWITNGPIADVIIVYAKTKKPDGKDAITAFLIEKDFKGFSIAQKLNKLGMRGSPTGELVFEDCVVPEENVLGELHKGVYVLMSGLDYERLVLSAGPVGIMQACLDTTLDYVTQRKQFGTVIGEFQLMQGKIAEMYMKLQSTRSFLYTLTQMADNGEIDNNECAALIHFASDNAVFVALEAIQALGGNGYINEYPTGRYLRDAKLYTIGAGTNEIRKWLIGRSLVKEFSSSK